MEDHIGKDKEPGLDFLVIDQGDLQEDVKIDDEDNILRTKIALTGEGHSPDTPDSGEADSPEPMVVKGSRLSNQTSSIEIVEDPEPELERYQDYARIEYFFNFLAGGEPNSTLSGYVTQVV